jgi:hypothetical protein
VVTAAIQEGHQAAQRTLAAATNGRQATRIHGDGSRPVVEACQQGNRLINRQGVMEQIALGLAHPLAQQPVPLGLGLHPLSGDRQAQIGEHGQHRAQQGASGLLGLIQTLHEGAIDLDALDRQRQQPRQ